MSNHPLMPKATAVWLIDNTALTFDQIAGFCGLHVLEVKGIADGDVASGVRGIDPIAHNQLTRDELAKGEADTTYALKITRPKTIMPEARKKAPRYTPVSKRQSRPDAIAWVVRNHPEVSDAQISRLLGTTKPTIQAVRDRSHWNSTNLEPRDPVSLGLCSQLDLDLIVKKAAAKRERLSADVPSQEAGPGLLPTEETISAAVPEVQDAVTQAQEKADEVDVTQVFANFTDNNDSDDT